MNDVKHCQKFVFSFILKHCLCTEEYIDNDEEVPGEKCLRKRHKKMKLDKKQDKKR